MLKFDPNNTSFSFDGAFNELHVILIEFENRLKENSTPFKVSAISIDKSTEFNITKKFAAELRRDFLGSDNSIDAVNFLIGMVKHKGENVRLKEMSYDFKARIEHAIKLLETSTC